jgi:hypothetical protein
MLQGVPVVALDHMIIFHVCAQNETERSKKLEKARRRISFSLWSLAGWEASCSWTSPPDVSPIVPESFNHCLDHGTRILWYKSYGLEAHEAILDDENLKARLKKLVIVGILSQIFQVVSESWIPQEQSHMLSRLSREHNWSKTCYASAHSAWFWPYSLKYQIAPHGKMTKNAPI